MKADWYLKATLAAVIAFFMYTTAGEIEGRIAPVVSGVRIDTTEAAKDGYTRIWGQFDLDRPKCEFRGMEWQLVGHSKNVTVVLIFEEGAKERPGGGQQFGPWRVQLTEQQLREQSVAVVYHQCPFRFWETVTRFYP